MNVLMDKKTSQPVGQCGLLIQNIENVDCLEIGYSILPQYWGLGYVTEAAMNVRIMPSEMTFQMS